MKGFHACLDTEDMLRKWFHRFQDLRRGSYRRDERKVDSRSLDGVQQNPGSKAENGIVGRAQCGLLFYKKSCRDEEECLK